MRFVDYLKEKFVDIILVSLVAVSIEAFLLVYDFAIFLKIYIPLSIFTTYSIVFFKEYNKKKHFYNDLIKKLNNLNEKYLVSEMIEDTNFLEAKILKNILVDVDKSMIENVNKYKRLQSEYKEYIELWIHEIKLPISASKIVIENNKNEITNSIDEEIDKIDNYVEQALFYARSNTVERDYTIIKCNLFDIVNKAIMKNKKELISKNTLIDMHNVDVIVNTDSKWIIFILSQIIRNSIQYSKENIQSKIEIYSKKNKNNIILYIRDNGIGIKKQDISKIFEKGFIGENGRLTGKKSTGIGLYLCKKLCNKLGLHISASSSSGEFSEFKITFPKNSLSDLNI